MRKLLWYDLITINIFWLGLNSVAQTITPLIVPLLIQHFVGTDLQGSYYGILRLWSLMTAILAQAVFGLFSDKFQSILGKRRPFILVGTIGLNLVIILIGFSRTLNGFSGFWVLFCLVLVLMLFANMAHGALQGLIPDLVPKVAYARYASMKAFFEVPLPVIIISLTIAKLIGDGNFWGGILILLFILDISALICMFVPENTTLLPQKSVGNWKAIASLFLMSLTFTFIIIVSRQLLLGIEWIASSLDLQGKSMFFIVAGTGLMISTSLFAVHLCVRIGLGKDHSGRAIISWWIINRLIFLLSLTNLTSFLLFFLQGKFSLTATEAVLPASILMRYVGFFILLIIIPIGWLSDRLSKKKYYL